MFWIEGRNYNIIEIMKIDLKPNEQVVKAGNSQYVNGSKVDGKDWRIDALLYWIG